MAAEEGVAPAALRNRPVLAPELAAVWLAFWDVYGDRQLGFGACGPILWSTLDRYAERHGLTDPDDYDAFMVRIRVLDDAYREAITPERDE